MRYRADIMLMYGFAGYLTAECCAGLSAAHINTPSPLSP